MNTASSMTDERPQILEMLASLLGRSGFTTDPDLLDPWLTDWRGRYRGAALGLASPASAQELSEVVKLCAAHGISMVPQGGNSGMSGGATPDGSGRSLLVSLRRMNAIRSVDASARQAICEAGVILQTLHEAAEDVGLRFPLTLGGKGSATVGGLISTNAGGTQVLRHGSMRGLVLGLEAVLPDGSIWSALTPLRKDNRGFDLKQLFIGSEGTLGIVTAATLQLVPSVADRVVVWAGVPDLQTARRLMLHCENSVGTALEGFEILPQSCLDAVLAHVPVARAPLADAHPWHALIEVVATDEASRASLADRVETMVGSAFEAGLLSDATLSASEAQAEAFWLIRESISAAERAKGPAMQHDIAVAVADMPDFLDLLIEAIEQEFPGTSAAGFGHLGDGNIHFHVLAPAGARQGEWEETQGKAISRLVHDLVTQWHGTISAEHGIGQMKRDELARLADPVMLSMMRSIKHAMDPQGLLNPGKLTN